MRVLLNRFATLGPKTGIGHYTAQLVRCLHELAPDEVCCFPAGLAWRLGQIWGKARPALTRGEGRPNAQPIGLGALWARVKKNALHTLRTLGQDFLARQLRHALAHDTFNLYHEPNTIPLPCDHATVTTMHDLSVFLHPQWHPAGRVAFFEKKFLSSLNRSRHFLAVSEFTRQEMIQILHVPPDRVTRVYNGIRPDLRPLPAAVTAAALHRLGLPPRYLLHVGTIEPRKNLLLLLRAYCALPESVRRECPLVLVGPWGWSSADVADYFHAEGKQRGVRHVGYLADHDLVAVYNGARALVYPSHYEGFGLPPLEMLACGGAVLASTARAVVEIVGGHAHLIDPDDADGWRDALARVIRDDEWWQHLRQGAVAVARPFTWPRCAAETLAVYRRLCAEEKQGQAA